jgi:sodium/potassium-transporting ATPase subunit alpha
MSRLKSDPIKGLTDADAVTRNRQQGDNKLSEKKKSPWWVRLLKEMVNPFAIMLWVGAFLCILAYVMQPEDKSNIYLGLILIFVVILTGVITY